MTISLRRFSVWSVATSLALLCCVYWPALSGPFIFDDLPNLQPVYDWLNGKVDATQTLFGNESGPLGRPLSMLTFMFSAMISGESPFGFKLFNLALHSLNFLLVLTLTRLLILSGGRHSERYAWLSAWVVASVWALHPIQVSTVAYVVQRMAMLATCFTLLALIAFVVASARPLSAAARRSLLFVAIPALTIAATLSKESGLLVPGYCLALHVGWTCRRTHLSRSELWVFFSLFLLLPIVAAAALTAFRPEWLLEPYRLRDFTLIERILTEPRVLFDYLHSYLLPHTAGAIVHMDDVAVSTGLLSPPTTLAALLAGVLIMAVALWRWQVSPALLGGVLFYLVGHALESTIFALELAFEHRNYLASLAIPLMLVSLILPSHRGYRWAVENRALAITMMVTIGVWLCGLTVIRTAEWSSRERLVQRSVSIRPESLRAQLDLAQLAIEVGRYDLANDVFAGLILSSDPRKRFTGETYAVFARCLQGEPISADWIQPIVDAAPAPLTLIELTVAEAISRTVESKRCASIPPDALAAALVGIVQKQDQPATDLPVWRIRYLAGSAYALAGQHEHARRLLDQTWTDSGRFPWAGLLLVKEALATGHQTQAQEVLKQLRADVPPGQHELWRQIDFWTAQLKQ